MKSEMLRKMCAVMMVAYTSSLLHAGGPMRVVLSETGIEPKVLTGALFEYDNLVNAKKISGKKLLEGLRSHSISEEQVTSLAMRFMQAENLPKIFQDKDMLEVSSGFKSVKFSFLNVSAHEATLLLNGKKLILNLDASVDENTKAIEKVLKEDASKFASFLNFLLPQAHAIDLLTVGLLALAVVAIVLVVKSYQQGKKIDKLEEQSQLAANRAKKDHQKIGELNQKIEDHKAADDAAADAAAAESVAPAEEAAVI